MSKASLIVPLPVPIRGLHLFQNPQAIPPDGAGYLSQLNVDDGVMRTRDGFSNFLDTPNTNVVIDLFNLRFNDGLTRALRCTAATGTSGATSPIHYDTQPSTWSPVTLDNTFGASGVSRFWAVVAPWASSIRGRIIASNNVKIKQWTGNAIDNMVDVAGGFPSRYGIIGPDNRLIIADIVEGGSQQLQRIRGTVPALINGTAADWTDPGSFAYDLRSDPYPITGLFVIRGQLFIGKERAIVQAFSTGDALDPYSFATLSTKGQGLFIPHSLVQYGNYAVFFTHDDVVLFDGVNLTSIGVPIWRQIFQRLNFSALDKITVEVDTEHKRVVWGVPLDNSLYPNALLKLNMADLTWSMDYPFSHSALMAYTGVDPTTYAELTALAGTYAGIPALGPYGNLTPSATPQSRLVVGRATGTTARSDPSVSSDSGGSSVLATYQSGALPVIGQQIIIDGKPRVIDATDQLVADEIVLNLLDRGANYTIAVLGTKNNGRTWELIANVSLTSVGIPSDALAKVVQKRITCRYAFGDLPMIRFLGFNGAKWGFAGGTIKIDVVGKRRRV